MGFNAYVCADLKVGDNLVPYPYEAGVALEKDGQCKFDRRAGLASRLNSTKYTMRLYCNYISSLRRIATVEDVEPVLALIHMGFIPLLCEPSFTEGAYAAYLTPLIEKSPIRDCIYRRRPSSFCKHPSDIPGVDIWVHRTDCVKMLGMNEKPERINVEMVLRKLGVMYFDNDVRDIH